MSHKFFKDKYGPWVIVAGAAEGLGEAYTIALAKRGVNLVMIDNQDKLLRILAARVEKQFDINTITLNIDLANREAAQKILEAVREIDCRLLLYNAAHTDIKSFTAFTTEELNSIIEVNMHTPVKLVHSFVRYLKRNKRAGGILLMSSLAGLIGIQLVAPYAATKAFTWNLAEALHHELKQYNIDIMACIAGATATPAYLATNPDYGLLKPTVMRPQKVAEEAISKLGRKTLFIPGFMNRLTYFILTRLLPRKAASAIVNKTMRNLYRYTTERE